MEYSWVEITVYLLDLFISKVEKHYRPVFLSLAWEKAEKEWSHAFTEGISTKWSANRVYKTIRRFHFICG